MVIAPVRSGGGMRMKVLEALARGKAVVTTELGAEGFAELGPNLPLAVADDAVAVWPRRRRRCSPTGPRRRELGARAREFAERHHEPGRLGSPARRRSTRRRAGSTAAQQGRIGDA